MEEKREVLLVDEQELQGKLHQIRGRFVMLDYDLAEIYEYTTKRFNEQVKNNKRTVSTSCRIFGKITC